jgi:hypothetical protein
MRSAFAFACAWLGLLPIAAVAQGRPRQPTFVRVLDAAGQPLAGAEVTFAGGLPHLAPAVPSDVLVVVSDARGRATAKLRPDLCYVTWAVVPPDTAAPEPLLRRSAVHGYFAAGALLEVACTQLWPAPRIRLQGHEAWAEHGPLQCVAWTEYPGTAEPLEGSEAEGFVVGRAATHASTLEVRDRAGRPLWTVGLGPRDAKLPPPQSIPVRVLDERGAPLAGVPIRQRVWRRQVLRPMGLGGVPEAQFAELGSTDADGRCTVVVAYEQPPLQFPGSADLFLFACPPGRPEVVGGVLQRKVLRDDRRGAVGSAELLFTCAAGEPLRARVQVPGGTRACLHAVCPLLTDAGSYLHDPRWYEVPVDGAGWFTFPAVPRQLHGSSLRLLLPNGAVWTFPFASGRELPEGMLASTEPWRSPTLTSLQVAVVEPDGGPARGAVLMLVPIGTQGANEVLGSLSRDAAMLLPVDAGGVTRLEVTTERSLCAVVTRQGFGALEVVTDGRPKEERLVLAPLPRMRVVVRDGDGRPVPGAHLSVAGSRTRGTGDVLEALWQSQAQAQRARLGELCTDARGELAIDFVPMPGVQLRLQFSHQGQRSEVFVLEANEAPLVVPLGR